MTWEEFWGVLFNNLYEFLFCFIFIFIVLFLIFRKNFFNLIDPLIIMLINISSSLTIILYLLLCEKRSNTKELLIILVINTVFLVSLKLNLSKKIINIGKKKQKKYFKIYYFLHTILFLNISILLITVVGMKVITNKLTAFSGIGWLLYLKTFFFPSQLILIFIKRELYKVKSKIDYILSLIVILLYIFSGSKVGLVLLILLISNILFYINEIEENHLYMIFKKNILKMVFLCIVGIIVGFSLVVSEGIILKIIHRIMSSGDIYYMLYINDNINKINGVSILDYYITSTFRPVLKYLIEIKQDIVLGFQAIEVVYNIQTKEYGPNARYDVIWQHNFNFIGIIGGYLSATLFAFLRRLRTKNFYVLNILVFLAVNLEAIISDFTVFGSLLFSILLCFIPLLIITEIVSKGVEKR